MLEDSNTFIDAYYLEELGVSYNIEDGGGTILFDIRYLSVILKMQVK